MNNKKQRLAILIISILVFVIGISYAYYSAVVQGTGNTNAKSSGKTATIGEVEFNGENTFDTTNIGRDIYPGFIGVQEFTISPYKDGTGIYEIDIAATIPEAFGNDIKLTIYKTSDATNNNIDSEEGTLTQNNIGFFKQDTLTINGVLEKVYEKPLINTELTILEQVDFKIENNTFSTPSATPDGYFTYYAVYEYLDNGNQNNQQGLDFSSKITVRYTTEVNERTNETLNYLASFNSNYVLSNSDNCLKTDSSGFIINPNSKLSDEDTPIVCSMKDDYGTSYYLRGLHTDNNVKFAGFCWKIIRVTGTGGIKMIYNGEPDQNGTCTTTEGTHNGFAGQTLTLSGNKMYGTSYTKSGDTYTLSDTTTMNWANDSNQIVGKYTCNTTGNSCEELYFAIGNNTTTDAYVLKLDQSTNYAQIGTSAYNINNRSLSSVGYMYNKDNEYNSVLKTVAPTGATIISQNKADTSNYYYGDSISRSGSYYYITNGDGSNVVQLDWANNYENNLVGKYTCKGTTKYNDTTIRCKTAYKVLDTTTKTDYMISENLTGGRLAIGTINVAADYSYDGTNYTLIDPVPLSAMDWYNNYRNYKYYYYCNNWNETTCSVLNYIYSPYDRDFGITEIVNNNYYYGTSFTYNENNQRPYTLTNTVHFWDAVDQDNSDSLKTHRYTCFYSNDDTCDKIYYIVALSGKSPYYIEMHGNETVFDALDKMLIDNDINRNDSNIKAAIDWWYETNILGTTSESQIEDTIFCNDRTIDDLGSWTDSENIKRYGHFNSGNDKISLKCQNKRDSFTVSNIKRGNGSLTYSVGLITTAELSLIGNNSAIKTGNLYWTGTPSTISDGPFQHCVTISGEWRSGLSHMPHLEYGARPVISLKKGTTFVDGGDGTPSNPFVVAE